MSRAALSDHQHHGDNTNEPVGSTGILYQRLPREAINRIKDAAAIHNSGSGQNGNIVLLSIELHVSVLLAKVQIAYQNQNSDLAYRLVAKAFQLTLPDRRVTMVSRARCQFWFGVFCDESDITRIRADAHLHFLEAIPMSDQHFPESILLLRYLRRYSLEIEEHIARNARDSREAEDLRMIVQEVMSLEGKEAGTQRPSSILRWLYSTASAFTTPKASPAFSRSSTLWTIPSNASMANIESECVHATLESQQIGGHPGTTSRFYTPSDSHQAPTIAPGSRHVNTSLMNNPIATQPYNTAQQISNPQLRNGFSQASSEHDPSASQNSNRQTIPDEQQPSGHWAVSHPPAANDATHRLSTQVRGPERPSSFVGIDEFLARIHRKINMKPPLSLSVRTSTDSDTTENFTTEDNPEALEFTAANAHKSDHNEEQHRPNSLLYRQLFEKVGNGDSLTDLHDQDTVQPYYATKAGSTTSQQLSQSSADENQLDHVVTSTVEKHEDIVSTSAEQVTDHNVASGTMSSEGHEPAEISTNQTPIERSQIGMLQLRLLANVAADAGALPARYPSVSSVSDSDTDRGADSFEQVEGAAIQTKVQSSPGRRFSRALQLLADVTLLSSSEGSSDVRSSEESEPSQKQLLHKLSDVPDDNGETEDLLLPNENSHESTKDFLPQDSGPELAAASEATHARISSSTRSAEPVDQALKDEKRRSSVHSISAHEPERLTESKISTSPQTSCQRIQPERGESMTSSVSSIFKDVKTLFEGSLISKIPPSPTEGRTHRERRKSVAPDQRPQQSLNPILHTETEDLIPESMNMSDALMPETIEERVQNTSSRRKSRDATIAMAIHLPLSDSSGNSAQVDLGNSSRRNSTVPVVHSPLRQEMNAGDDQSGIP